MENINFFGKDDLVGERKRGTRGTSGRMILFSSISTRDTGFYLQYQPHCFDNFIVIVESLVTRLHARWHFSLKPLQQVCWAEFQSGANGTKSPWAPNYKAFLTRSFLMARQKKDRLTFCAKYLSGSNFLAEASSLRPFPAHKDFAISPTFD